ncbi:hypothetical protein [Geodermatophilus ruber]|uniref:Transcriptional regulator, AbiEi antitoxin, Type IV TA system n=1 Tax=Geodermatophilus ruber TaxID=504800 RepID=A0A1I4FJP8_9ACTN|nr:hypothetical protein [Geodermatophilus ruber]SFL16691.1 hypothetical protein SAMN04488085_107143 [Geodermatophilus ruber]
MEGIPLGSSYTWSEARRRGVTRRQIAADGVAIGRGLYLSRAVEPTLAERCRAWAGLLPADAAFGLGTATALYGVTDPEPHALHVVLRPRSVLPQQTELTVHARRLTDEDVVVHGDLRLTSGPQTYLDMAARLLAPDLLALGDALMHAGHMDSEALERRLSRADRVRGVVRAREWAPHLSGRAASPRESWLRYCLLASDLPDPVMQVPIVDRWGRAVVHADLGYPAWKLALEYEGRQHAEREQFDRDIDRYSLMAADGWLVLRFGARNSGAGVVVERTRRALLSRGWQPGLS